MKNYRFQIAILALAGALLACNYIYHQPAQKPTATVVLQEPTATVASQEPTVTMTPQEPTATMTPQEPTAAVTPQELTATVASQEATATVASIVKVGYCQWNVSFQLSGFSPNSQITISSQGRRYSCATEKGEDYAWDNDTRRSTDSTGSVRVGYTHNDYGTYTYTFTDSDGHTASATVSYKATQK